MRREPSPSTRNDLEITGDTGTAIQAGVVHGGIQIRPSDDTYAPPRQLPMDAAVFVNRETYLANLDQLLQTGRTGNDPRTAVSAITGAPGVGKTALAVHWAHRVRKHFTDGQLYIDLQGHGPGTTLEAAQALEGILRALNVAAHRIPQDLDGRAAVYRSILTGRRLLIVLDNANSADQVRPLLPGSSGSLVIVTSRSALAGLVARE
ncbi:AAA family ATPase, partial [Actinomadura adrarensis]